LEKKKRFKEQDRQRTITEHNGVFAFNIYIDFVLSAENRTYLGLQGCEVPDFN